MQKLQHLKRMFRSNSIRRILVPCKISAAKTLLLAVAIIFSAATPVFSAEPGRQTLAGHMPAVLVGLTPKGRLSATNHVFLAIGLPLRDEAGLDELLQQLYDPHSTNFHKFLAPAEFTARFGPTEQDYQAVIKFAEANNMTVTGKHGNRVVLDVEEQGASQIEQAFQVKLGIYHHPADTHDFFAPDTDLCIRAHEFTGGGHVGLDGLRASPTAVTSRVDPSKNQSIKL